MIETSLTEAGALTSIDLKSPRARDLNWSDRVAWLCWAGRMHGISAEEAVAGKDYLDAFVKLTGGLDWHVAWHPYPADLFNPRAWVDETAISDNSSHKVTFKNLEVLCRHLRQPELLFKGEPRRVILSEQGFHTLPDPEGETLQAAAYAYAWEKCRKLPLVDAFIYHRHVDHAYEGGLLLGLWKNLAPRERVSLAPPVSGSRTHFTAPAEKERPRSTSNQT